VAKISVDVEIDPDSTVPCIEVIDDETVWLSVEAASFELTLSGNPAYLKRLLTNMQAALASLDRPTPPTKPTTSRSAPIVH
jgi:hypothetical protein